MSHHASTGTFGGSPTSASGLGLVPSGSFNGAAVSLTNKFTTLSMNNTKPIPYSPPQLRGKDNGFGIEDPFNSPPANTVPTPAGPKKKTKSSSSKNWRSSSDGSSDVAPLSPSTGRGSRSRLSSDPNNNLEMAGVSFTSSIKRGPVRAQGLYPPSACVFVGNLPAEQDDIDIEAYLTRKCSKFGTVWIKLRRDKNNNPFAFCQYTTEQEGRTAMVELQGKKILGTRECRTEMARACRSFLLERQYGPPMRVEEASQVAGHFGELAEVRYPTDAERSNHRITDGVFIMYEYYEQGQDAFRHFRNHAVYKIKSLQNKSKDTPARPNPASQQYLINYDLDRRSVFVGNLPTDAMESELAEFFRQCGEVLRVTIHKPDSIINASQKYCFAFIEFDTYEEAASAVNQLNSELFQGKNLKVTPKDTDAAKVRSSTRRQTRVSPNYYNTPAPSRVRAPQQYSQQYSPSRGASRAAPVAYGSNAYVQNPSAMGTSPPVDYGSFAGNAAYITPPPTNVALASGPCPGYDAYAHYDLLYGQNMQMAAMGQPPYWDLSKFWAPYHYGGAYYGSPIQPQHIYQQPTPTHWSQVSQVPQRQPVWVQQPQHAYPVSRSPSEYLTVSALEEQLGVSSSATGGQTYSESGGAVLDTSFSI